MHGMTTAMQTEAEAGDYVIAETARRWYGLLIVSGHERKACIWLRRRQYEPYWPRFMGMVKLNRHRRAKRWRSVIPGYLFLPTSEGANWELIKKAPGVHGVMSFGNGNYVEIPELGKDGIEKIREIAAALNASSVAAEQGIPFKKDQKAWLERLSQEVTILAIDSRNKIQVEAKMFGASMPIWVAVDDLEAV